MADGATTLHVRPTAALAPQVLLPGDPGRALALAQALLAEPRMFNHHRGLWGYTGLTADGLALTIQATGMGGPSAAIVLHELIALGARAAIRVGSCGALAPQLQLGELVIAREAICADGTSRALGAGERVTADEELRRELEGAAPGAHAGAVVSVDLFYEEDAAAGAGNEVRAAARASDHADALAVEMETGTLFALGRRAGIRVACVLAVSDTFTGPAGARQRIADHALLESSETMASAAVAALAACVALQSGDRAGA